MNINKLLFRRRKEESKVYEGVLLPDVCVLRIFSAREGKLPRSSVGALFAFKIPANFFFWREPRSLFKPTHLRLMISSILTKKKKGKIINTIVMYV